MAPGSIPTVLAQGAHAAVVAEPVPLTTTGVTPGITLPIAANDGVSGLSVALPGRG